jgi:mannose-6-phosphate isomerase
LIRRVLRKSAPDGNDSSSVSILGHPDQRVMNGPFIGQRLDQVVASHRSWLVGEANLEHDASFEDHGGGTPVQVGRSTMVCHVLWCAGERSAHLLAGIDPAADDGSRTDPDRLVRRPVSPGDTITIPAGVPHAFGPGILAYHLSVPAAPNQRASHPVPTHGLAWFEGFNRRTICAGGPGFILERWKITQPLRVPRSGARWMFLTNLVEPVALAWPNGGDIIGRGESRLIPAGMGSLTLVPDGIAYVLCLSVPDLSRDVIGPLRRAGYRDDEIALLGALR